MAEGILMILTLLLALFVSAWPSSRQPAPAALPVQKTLAEADCTRSALGGTVPIAAIKEPVSGVTLGDPRWTVASGAVPAYCAVDGVISPIDRRHTATPINFRVML